MHPRLQFVFQDQYLAQNFPNIERYQFNDTRKVIQMLIEGEVQAIVAEIPYLRSQLSQMGLEGVFFSKEVWNNEYE